MAQERGFRVKVTFDRGVKAYVWIHEEPVFFTLLWTPERLACIGDPHGPPIEFLKRELSEMVVVPSVLAMTWDGSRDHFGMDQARSGRVGCCRIGHRSRASSRSSGEAGSRGWMTPLRDPVLPFLCCRVFG